MKMSRERLEQIRAIANSKEFSPETADVLLSELIAHADKTTPPMLSDEVRAAMFKTCRFTTTTP